MTLPAPRTQGIGPPVTDVDAAQVDLRGLGLSRQQVAVYLGLIDSGPATLEQVCSGTGTAHDVAEEAVAALRSLGLVLLDDDTPARYRCTPPDIAIERAAAQAESSLLTARSAAPELIRRYTDAQTPSTQARVQVITGSYASLSRHSEQFLGATNRVVRTTQLSITVPTELPDDVDDPAVNANLLEVLGRGVRIHALYAVKDGHDLAYLRDCLEPYREAGADFRMVDDLPCRMFLYDDDLASVVLTQPQGIEGVCVVRASPVLAGLRRLFDDLWATATPLFNAAGRVEDHELLIAALASGVTDRVICRQLGWSRSTLQRRLRSLQEAHGVSTRFQLGQRLASSGPERSTPTSAP